MSSPAHPTIAIIGSTGGTGLAILRQCLAAEYSVTALVRQPAKLLSLLSVASAPANLTIVSGSVRDLAAIKSALCGPDGSPVDIVISCIGIVASPIATRGVDKTICNDATHIIVQCLAELQAATETPAADAAPSRRPLLVVLSSTGVTRVTRDVPLVLVPLYRILIGPQHKDKRDMERYLHTLSSAALQWIIVRPSMLTGDGKGQPTARKIRVGVEADGKVESRAVGYTISREDVGRWLFESVVAADSAEPWLGKCVTLTY